MDIDNLLEVKSDKRHVCQTCGASFNRPYRLTQHLLLHQNIKIFQCGEEGCDKSYTSKSHLDRHLFSAHMKPDFDEVHRCPECMKTFSNRQNLKRHIKIKHAIKAAFTCDVCRTGFKKKHQLLTHMYYHTLVKPFSCELCDKEFISLLERKKHMKYHKTYNCEYCDMAFNQWSKYQKHIKAEHNVTEYNCNECGRKFKQRNHMVHHVKIHKLNKPEQKFTCWYEGCNRVYSRHSNLKQHIEMKHMQITYPCQICGARLSTKMALKRHLKTHSKPEDLSMRKKPKTKETGRKERKDKGSTKNSVALKIAGLFNIENEKTDERDEKNPSENVVSHQSNKEATVSGIGKNISVNGDNVNEDMVDARDILQVKTAVSSQNMSINENVSDIMFDSRENCHGKAIVTGSDKNISVGNENVNVNMVISCDKLQEKNTLSGSDKNMSQNDNNVDANDHLETTSSGSGKNMSADEDNVSGAVIISLDNVDKTETSAVNEREVTSESYENSVAAS